MKHYEVNPYDLMCVVPVYNEEEILSLSVPMLVDELEKLLPDQKLCVIIADNGSTDGTAAVSRELEQRYPEIVQYRRTELRGRGNAFREVFAGPDTADRYLYVDADLPFELEDLASLLDELQYGADLVICRRTGGRPAVRYLMTAFLRWYNRVVFGVRASDSQCAVKGMSPAAARVLVEDCLQRGWYLDTELVVLANKRGLTVREVTIRWLEQRFPGRASKVRIGQDVVAGLRALRQIGRRRREIR